MILGRYITTKILQTLYHTMERQRRNLDFQTKVSVWVSSKCRVGVALAHSDATGRVGGWGWGGGVLRL
jgi:hypothetical protein